MAPKLASKCAHCQTGTSEKWHTIEKGVILCIPCYENHVKVQRELEDELKVIQSEAVKLDPVSEGLSVAITSENELKLLAETAVIDAEKKIEKRESAEDTKDEAGDEREDKDSNVDSKEKPVLSLSPRKLRKNVRSSRKGGAGGSGGNGNKTGRSRRFIFKKNPMKAPSITVTTRTVDTLFHNVSRRDLLHHDVKIHLNF